MLIDKTESRALTLWHYFSQKPIIHEILEQIEREIKRDRYQYHNVYHAHEVAEEALLFALYEDKITHRSLELLAIASAYHDAGYLVQYEQNEPIGAGLAARAMRQSGGYRELEIARVRQAILGTALEPDRGGRLIQSVVEGDLLGLYLADADLGNLGRPDFRVKSEALFEEFLQVRKIPVDTETSRKRFKELTLSLMHDHKYYTPAAQTLRNPLKLAHRALLAAELREGPDRF